MRFASTLAWHWNIDDRFARTRKIFDVRMKSLVAQGIRTTKRQADPILLEQEDILWEKEVFCSRFAKSIQNTVFFYAYKVFGLRECDEHRKLMCKQFILNSDDRGNSFSSWADKEKPTREDYDRCSWAIKTSSITVHQVKEAYIYYFRLVPKHWATL